MGNLSVNNGTAYTNQVAAKKPSKVKIAAGVAALAGVAILGAGLATGNVKPGDIATFAQKTGTNVLNTLKHPKSIPAKLYALVGTGIEKATEAVVGTAYNIKDGAELAFGYAKAIGSAVVDVFGKK